MKIESQQQRILEYSSKRVNVLELHLSLKKKLSPVCSLIYQISHASNPLSVSAFKL